MPENWSPKHVDSEQEFTAFIKKRGGQLIEDLMLKNDPRKQYNADFYFSDDGIVAELKCLMNECASTHLQPERIVNAYRACGRTGSEMFGYLFRGESMPEDVATRLFAANSRSLRAIVEKGNKQIRASKRFLEKSDACGVLFVANDNNLGFGPTTINSILGHAAANLKDNYVDALVYFTTNVFHQSPGSDTAWQLWLPSYRVGCPDRLVPFINDLGAAWGAHLTEVTGEPPIGRRIFSDVDEAHKEIRRMQPIEHFRPRKPVNP